MHTRVAALTIRSIAARVLTWILVSHVRFGFLFSADHDSAKNRFWKVLRQCTLYSWHFIHDTNCWHPSSYSSGLTVCWYRFDIKTLQAFTCGGTSAFAGTVALVFPVEGRKFSKSTAMNRYCAGPADFSMRQCHLSKYLWMIFSKRSNALLVSVCFVNFSSQNNDFLIYCSNKQIFHHHMLFININSKHYYTVRKKRAANRLIKTVEKSIAAMKGNNFLLLSIG